MPKLEITLQIETASAENAQFIRHELERLLDAPNEFRDSDNRPFFESISRRNEMRGSAKLINVRAARLRLPK